MHANQKRREGGAPVRLETHSFPVPGRDSLAISFGRLTFLPAVPTSWTFTCLTLLEYFLDIITVIGTADTVIYSFWDLFSTHCAPDAGTINLTSGSFQCRGREKEVCTL